MPRSPFLPTFLTLAIFVFCAGPAAAIQATPPAADGRCVAGDCEHGQGTFVASDGTQFTGAFTKGKLNGQGTRTFANGNKYIGLFKDSKYDGQGTFTTADGDKYAGQFKDDNFGGQGTFTTANGDKHVGLFRKGLMNGQGTFTTANGDKYVGQFKDGSYGGQGTFTSANGDKYVGLFKNNLLIGQGTFTTANGDKYVGQFKDGNPDGQGTHTLANGAKYVGLFKDGNPNGQGTLAQAGVMKYVGEFKNGRLHGQGTYTWPSGAVYVGEFQDDKKNGPGLETKPDGRVTRGIWANDKLVTPLSEQKYAAALGKAEGTAQADSLAAERQRLEAERQQLAAERQQLAQQQAQAQPTLQPSAQPKGSASPGRRVALIIGNASYPTAPLKNPVNDARDMATALKSLGFEVILRENASLAQMEGAVEEFWAKLKRGGAGLFYFAGHGLQVNGKNYLVPVDAKLSAEQDARYKCMDAGLVLGRMENAGNDLNLVILDACRNNPFARSWRSAEQGLAKMDAPKGSIIAYATAPDSVAADGQGRNGVYTEKLLKAIRMPGQPVELVFKRVRDEVMRATGDKQVPWESTSLRGDFYFTNP